MPLMRCLIIELSDPLKMKQYSTNTQLVPSQVDFIQHWFLYSVCIYIYMYLPFIFNRRSLQHNIISILATGWFTWIIHVTFKVMAFKRLHVLLYIICKHVIVYKINKYKKNYQLCKLFHWGKKINSYILWSS